MNEEFLSLLHAADELSDYMADDESVYPKAKGRALRGLRAQISQARAALKEQKNCSCVCHTGACHECKYDHAFGTTK